MMTPVAMPTAAEFAALAPEIFLACATFTLLIADLFIQQARRGLTHALALLILLGTAFLTLRGGGAGQEAVSAFNGMFVRDGAGDILKLAIYVVTAAAFVYARPYLVDRDLYKGEYYSITLFAVLGMMLLVSADHLVMVYLGLELLALSSYALVAFDRDSKIGSEAAMKYFVLGSLASGMLLYGMSMVYGATGALDLQAIHAAASSTGERTLLMFGVVFIVVGIAFKFGAAPFHMWLPDVYQGAPTPVTLFIGSAPKLAAFGMAYRLLEAGVGPLEAGWSQALSALAVASLVIGNIVALVQTNLKRMLAYSTISHVGFLFLGLAAADGGGYAAAMFYAIAYALMAAAGFGSLLLLSRRGFEAQDIADFAGLGRRHPVHALMVLFVMASMAGVPPFLGFWAKLAVIDAAVGADLVWLAIVAVAASVVGLFYYLRVIKVMYFDAAEPGREPVPSADAHLRVVFVANAALLLVLGFAWGPLMAACERAFGA